MLRRPHPSTDREGEPSDEEGFGGDTERDHRPVRKRDQKESVTGDTAKPMQATTRHGMQPSPEASATASSWTALRRTTHDPDRRPTRMGHLDITGIVRPSQRDMPCDTRGHLCISATPRQAPTRTPVLKALLRADSCSRTCVAASNAADCRARGFTRWCCPTQRLLEWEQLPGVRPIGDLLNAHP